MNWKTQILSVFATIVWAALLVILFVPDIIKEQYKDRYKRSLNTSIVWQVHYVWGKWKDDLEVILRKVRQL